MEESANKSLSVDAGRGRSAASLSVNRSFSKIGKGLRKPAVQPKPVAPKVYNTDRTSFRNLVQELTGTVAAAAPALARLPSTRLQKIAPPPLNTFSFSGLPLPLLSQNPNSSSAFQKAFSPIPLLSPHSFSPFPVLTPSHRVWPNLLDSPNTADLRILAQKMVEFENAKSNRSVSLDAVPSFPWSPVASPATQSRFGHLRPGHGLGVFYGGFAEEDSTSPVAVNCFSFPEPDYVSGFS